MNSLLRLLFGLGVIGVLLALVGRFVAPCLLSDLGMDWWNLTEQYRQHRLELARAEDLARRDGVLADRINTKSAVTQRLIAGKITLLEAAACFGELNDIASDCPSGYRNFFPGASDGEKLCRQVLAWVQGEMGQDSRQNALLARLENELDTHLKKDGRIILPR